MRSTIESFKMPTNGFRRHSLKSVRRIELSTERNEFTRQVNERSQSKRTDLRPNEEELFSELQSNSEKPPRARSTSPVWKDGDCKICMLEIRSNEDLFSLSCHHVYHLVRSLGSFLNALCCFSLSFGTVLSVQDN